MAFEARALKEPNGLAPRPRPESKGEDMAELPLEPEPEVIGEVPLTPEQQQEDRFDKRALEREGKEDRRRRWERALNLKRVGEPKSRGGVLLGGKRLYIKSDEWGMPVNLGKGAFGAVAEAQVPVEYWGDQLRHKNLNVEQMADTLKTNLVKYTNVGAEYARDPSAENLEDLEYTQENVLAVFSALSSMEPEKQKQFAGSAIHLEDAQKLVHEAYRNIQRYRGQGKKIAEAVKNLEQAMQKLENPESKLRMRDDIMALKAAGALLSEEEKNNFYETLEPGTTNLVIKYTDIISRFKEDKEGKLIVEPDGQQNLRPPEEVMTFRELDALKKMEGVEGFPRLEGAYEMRTSPVAVPTMEWVNRADNETEKKERMAARKEALKDRPIDAVRIFYVETKMPGKNLYDQLDKHGHFSAEETLEIARAIAERMAEMHKRGLVNRDLKPANIMYDRDNKAVNLIDLGLAVDANERTSAFEKIKNKTIARAKELALEIMIDFKDEMANKEIDEGLVISDVYSRFLSDWAADPASREFKEYLSKGENEKIYLLMRRELQEFILEAIDVARLGKISKDGQKRIAGAKGEIDNLLKQGFSGNEIVEFYRLEYDVDEKLSALPRAEREAEMDQIVELVKARISPAQRKQLAALWKGIFSEKALVRGTTAFMAPEQIAGTGDKSPLVDIYSLGVIIEGLYRGRKALPIIGMGMKEATLAAARGQSIDRKINVDGIQDYEEKVMAWLAREIATIDADQRPQSMEFVIKIIDEAEQAIREYKRAPAV